MQLCKHFLDGYPPLIQFLLTSSWIMWSVFCIWSARHPINGVNAGLDAVGAGIDQASQAVSDAVGGAVDGLIDSAAGARGMDALPQFDGLMGAFNYF